MVFCFKRDEELDLNFNYENYWHREKLEDVLKKNKMDNIQKTIREHNGCQHFLIFPLIIASNVSCIKCLSLMTLVSFVYFSNDPDNDCLLEPRSKSTETDDT